ncbi:MAG: histidine--tRNA ligase [candidate division KSB1 bacterium]|jgi:histidyl-tRNA synthetase|nr:histidine--tRNA ligase [candidate division KSB1 bacterium]
MTYIKPSIPKGTRDFLPEQMLRRQFVIETVKGIFEKYGYQPLETPSIEKLEVLSGKYGEEGEQLIFKILKRGTEIDKIGKSIDSYTVKDLSDLVDFALRYDLTVPLCRVIAMYQNEITLPFKRYQIQPVWRGDRPQRGRYREFYQCDVDTIGSKSLMVDAENIALVDEILSTLGFDKFKIRINNRKILTGIAEYANVIEKENDISIAIDKLDKIGIDGVKEELKRRGIPEDAIATLLTVLEIKGEPESVLAQIKDILVNSETGSAGVSEIEQLIENIRAMDVSHDHYAIDLYLARGLSYYTGPIYESIVSEPNIGSLTGGGRYDELVGMFLGKEIPASGTTIGLERIIYVMTQLDMIPETKTKSQVLVTLFSEEMRTSSMTTIQTLRSNNINAEIFFDPKNLKKQFNYANQKNIPYVIVIGPDEAKEDKVSVKEMKTGTQTIIQRSELVDFLNKRFA